ncbi:MAG: hybrid sensor histidine kinase/response regulator [Campylobacterota bacterium]|nr:hybrid sensor histidine kinase/response regulator [Campylobacterota bacterium]
MQINILIVDDIEANLISLEALLDSLDNNYNIIKANSGTKALELTLSLKIDLIILDIQMPDIDGFEVAGLLKSNKKTKDIPIIFLTAAFKSNEWIEKGFKIGAIDYLTKPIDENQFINRITLYTRLIETIEENREKDKKLFEQSKMASMGDMIGNIAHQWRQPLSIITTAASGIQIKKEFDSLTDEFLEDMLNKINNSAQYLSDTIDDFRDFIKGDSIKSNFNISQYIEKGISLVDGVLKTYSIKVIKDIDNGISTNNYANLFLQILANILNNSKDALKEIEKDNKFIFITLKKNNGKIILTIKDNGGGIPKEVLPKIFEAYFTTKHKSQGTGLGLYMTFNMCKTMEIDIDIKNETFEYKNKVYTGVDCSLLIKDENLII